jgi:hypothetical protein
MAMKKTSGGDSPLRQGVGKSFWTLPISGRWRRRIAMYSGKVIGYLGFSRQEVFIGEGASSEVVLVGLTKGVSELVSYNSENISCVAFLKHKTAENRNWHCGILSIG